MTEPTRAARIEALLRAALQPIELIIEDDSFRHAGHAGASAAGETHFSLRIVAAAFEGLTRVDRSRLVHNILVTELNSGLHALSLKLRTPDENQPSN